MGKSVFENDGVLKDKAQSPLRWIILFLTCIMMIGNYYSYDIPAALHTQLNDYMGKPKEYELYFSLLYTVYSVPNCVLPFFGGFFVDKLGVRLCLLAFVLFISLGQVVFSFGVSIENWPLMFLGRILFGIGGESLSVGNSALLAEWFKGKELAFAFGLNLSVARLGSVFNNILSPILARTSVPIALWAGSILCGISVVSVVFIGSIDKSIDNAIAVGGGLHAKLNIDDDDNDNEVIVDFPGSEVKNENEEAVGLSSVFSFGVAFWLLAVSCVVVYGCVLPFNNIASGLLLERDFFMANPSDCMLTNQTQCQINGNVPIKGCPSSSSFYQPPLPTSVEFDGTYYNPLTAEDIDCSNDLWSDKGSCGYEFCKKLAAGQVQSGAVMSIPYVISACLSPILGGIVDKVGKRAIIATLAPMFLIIVHLMLGLTTINPIGPLVGQGLAYSGFAAVLWPSVPLVVEPQFIGLGYGVITSVQNAGLAFFPLIVAAIYSTDELYIPNVEFFFVGLASIGFLVGIYLNIYDAKHGNIFNSAGGDTRSSYDRTISRDGHQKGPFAKSVRGKRVSWEDSGSGKGDVSTINALLDEGRVKNFASKQVTINT